VGRDDENRAKRASAPQRFQQIDGAHDIHRECINRHHIRPTNERLCSHVNDDLGIGFVNCGSQSLCIPQIADMRAHGVLHACEREEVWLCIRCERKARDLCAHAREPKCGPPSLEASVPGQKDTLSTPERRVEPVNSHVSSPKASTAPCRTPKALRDNSFRAAYPWVARIRNEGSS